MNTDLPRRTRDVGDPEAESLLGSLRRDLSEGDDAAVQRVGRRLERSQRVERRRWVVPVWGVGAAVVATAVAVVLVLRLVPASPGGTGTDTAALAAGTGVAAGTTAQTARLADGGVELTLGPESDVLRLGDAEGGVPVLELQRGVVAVDVTPGSVPGLHVVAGPVRVRVLGTSFVVTRQQDEVTVSVARGRVEVLHRGTERPLGAGQAWGTATDANGGDMEPGPDGDVSPPVSPTEPPEPPESPPAASPMESHESTPEPGPETAALALTDAERDFLAIQDALAGGAPPDEVLDATSSYLATHPAGPLTVEVEAWQVEATARAGRHQEAYQLAAAFGREHPNSPRSLQILTLQATVARDRLRDCSLAIEPYRELTGRLGTGPRAAEAHYYLAVCALEQGRRDEAETALRRCLELAADGPHAAHARELLTGFAGAATDPAPTPVP